MIVNVEVKRQGNENAAGVIRRFTRRVQGAGIVRRVRSIRYRERELSRYTRRKKTLRRIEKEKIRERLRKLGRIS